MKCIVCDNAEGEHDWWLSPVDFELKGVKNQTKYYLKNCFCEYCYADANRDKGLDHYLFNYWLSIQPIEELMKEETVIKYPTKEEYPDGFDWFAYDADGRAFWYKSRPFYKLEDKSWFVANYTDCECAYDYDVDECSLWKNTLLCKDDLREETKPNYYTWHPVTSCVKVSQLFSGNLAQAIQYIWRSETLNPQSITKGQSKAEVIADLNKAIDFIKFEIERLENSE